MTALSVLRSCIFQFTPLREGRRETENMGVGNGLFQFTPLREGRLFVLPDGRSPSAISIHAPA